MKIAITQNFYDQMANQYDKLFQNWEETTKEQAALLDKIFKSYGFDTDAELLDCACGIGTQAVGIAQKGYKVTASDLSEGELAEAKKRAADNHVDIVFTQVDFCALSKTFDRQFDIVIAMDNALPHMLSHEALASAVNSISDRTKSGGIFVASIRDYDSILAEKPTYSPPYIHKTEGGQRVSFQTWDWNGDHYQFTQYIIEDEGEPRISKFACEYRAVRRQELTDLLLAGGFCEVIWKMPEETGFYQPIVVAR